VQRAPGIPCSLPCLEGPRYSNLDASRREIIFVVLDKPSMNVIAGTAHRTLFPFPLWERVDAMRSIADGEGMSPRMLNARIDTLIRRFAPPSPTRGEGKDPNQFTLISALIMSAAFSPIMMVGALVLPPISVASQRRRRRAGLRGP